MRILEIIAVLALLGISFAAFRTLWRGRPPVRREWEPFHNFEDGRRRVYVRWGDQFEPIGDLDPGDPSYDDDFLRLMDQARQRAAVLNSER
jgi:hypothetical protein